MPEVSGLVEKLGKIKVMGCGWTSYEEGSLKDEHPEILRAILEAVAEEMPRLKAQFGDKPEVGDKVEILECNCKETHGRGGVLTRIGVKDYDVWLPWSKRTCVASQVRLISKASQKKSLREFLLEERYSPELLQIPSVQSANLLGEYKAVKRWLTSKRTATSDYKTNTVVCELIAELGGEEQ